MQLISVKRMELKMWVDKKIYWAWMSSEECNSKPPTEKILDYVTIDNRGIKHKLCIGVFDDEKYTSLYRDELEFHLKHD